MLISFRAFAQRFAMNSRALSLLCLYFVLCLRLVPHLNLYMIHEDEFRLGHKLGYKMKIILCAKIVNVWGKCSGILAMQLKVFGSAVQCFMGLACEY